MKVRFIFASLVAGALSLMTATAAELGVGDDTPDFTLMGSDGKTYSNADFKEKQALVIAFFPKAFTGG